jgi:hypothetical protein
LLSSRTLQAAEKVPEPFCHSEGSEESYFLFLNLIPEEIPRFARNGKINDFFRSLYKFLASSRNSRSKWDDDTPRANEVASVFQNARQSSFAARSGQETTFR